MSSSQRLSPTFLLLVASLAYAPLLLAPGPDSFLGLRNQQTEEERLRVREEQLTFDVALERIERVNQYLNSFRLLTSYLDEKAEEKAGPTIEVNLNDLADIGNLDVQVQNLGFYNVMTAITGTVLRQNAELKKLQYTILTLQKADSESVLKAESEMKASREAFDGFLKNRHWAD